VRDLDRIREVREYRISGPQVMTFLVSGLLLIGSVFVLGYQFGRLRAPSDAALLAPLGSAEQRDPGAVLAEMMARRTSEAALSAGTPALTAVEDHLTASDDTAESPGLVASDVAALPVDAEITSAEAATAPLPEPPDEPESEVVPEPEVVVEHVSVAVVPEPEPTPEAVPELPSVEARVLPAAPSGRGYTVQVGAYETQEEAAATIRALQAQGLPVFHVSALVNGKTWHRVRVGMHATRALADASAEQLAEATEYTPYVTSQP
jgi:cell division septation protein DedD